MPQKEFEIYEEDFSKTVMDYLMFEQNIDVKRFSESLLNRVLYSSNIVADDENINIIIPTRNEKNWHNRVERI